MLLPNKSCGVRFVTDFRKLNLTTKRHPCPLPNVNDTLRKMKGFAHDEFVDVNMEYYHALLDKKSQEICTVLLPWGKHTCTFLPQGLNCSPDVFQEKMDAVFHGMEQVFFCIDDI